MWDLIVSVPDHCLSFYIDHFVPIFRHTKPIHTSYNMGLFKQTWRFKSFLPAQCFGLWSFSKRYVCITHTFLLEDKQCLLKKLHLRSENGPAKRCTPLHIKRKT